VRIGVQDKFPLLFCCARSSATFIHHVRILRPTLIASAAIAADDDIAAAATTVACRTPQSYFPMYMYMCMVTSSVLRARE
jgi:hypothetical protein